MSEYLGIKPLPCDKPAPPPNKKVKQGSPSICARPGHNIITHCIEEKGHEGYHTYSPVPDDDEKMSDRLEEVMRMLTETCPNYQVGDFVTPRPTCCIFHRAAKTVMEAQKILRVVGR